MRISDWSSDVCSSDLLMGSTDVQIARLFQRRIALDALFGGMLGTAGSVLVLILLGILIRNIGSDLLGSARLPGYGWGVLLLLPLGGVRSEEHTSELQSLMRISYAVFCLKKKKTKTPTQ